jgi:hypothetical protein
MVVAPGIDVVKRGILITSVAKLGSGLGGILLKKNLNQSMALLVITIGVVGTSNGVY